MPSATIYGALCTPRNGLQVHLLAFWNNTTVLQAALWALGQFGSLGMPQLTFKDEAQTALIKNPVRTAL